MHKEPTSVERHRVFRQLLMCKMAEGASVHLHVQEMIGLIDQLGKLAYEVNVELTTYIILKSLLPSFSKFVENYNLAGELKPLSELQSILATAESSIRKVHDVLTVKKVGKKVSKKDMKTKSKGL